jgi:glycosyltransferase involved in cell wall biosynthesis
LPTRICSIITRLNVGGPARQAVALTKHFRDSHLIYGSLAKGEVLLPEAEDLPADRTTQVESMSRSISPSADNKALNRITAELKRLKPDIVHTHTSKAGFLGRIAARRSGVPVTVHTFHGHVFHSYFSRTVARMFLEIERGLARKTDALITLSQSQQSEFINTYRFPNAERFSVIPLGFDMTPFGNLPERGKLRAELGIPDDAFTVGFVGRLEPVKQPELFIEIISKVEGIHGVIIGGGRLEAAMRRLVEKKKLEDRVHFAGWRSDLPQIYADLDAVALTSANEGTPVALIEAAACGLPSVAFDVGGVRDIVSEENGFPVPPGDITRAVECLKELAGSPGLCRKLGAAGRKSAMEKFNFNRMARDLENLYDSLVQKSGPGQK